MRYYKTLHTIQIIRYLFNSSGRFDLELYETLYQQLTEIQSESQLFQENLKNPSGNKTKLLKFQNLQSYHYVIQFLVNSKKTAHSLATIERDF